MKKKDKFFFKKIDDTDPCLKPGEFLMWLSKKGVKRVKKYGKKKD